MGTPLEDQGGSSPGRDAGRSDHVRAALTLGALLVLCVLLRLAVLVQFWSDLSDDRDAYLGIAQGIAAGRGFSVPGSERPTAFRPPLYPLLLAPWADDEARLGRAMLHLLAAAGTAALLWGTATHLGMSRLAQALGTLLFVVDPLLLRYIAFPMTETLTVFLSTLLLFQLTRPAPAPAPAPPSVVRAFLTGLTLGACVLCRPTYWAFVILYVPFHAVHVRSRERAASTGAVQESTPSVWPGRLAVLGGVALLVLPWTIRNGLVLGAPVVMTTHGGYTVLLGNNEAFYREVVAAPWGTLWDGSRGKGQAAWAEEVDQELERAGLESELERDRWMARRARRTIRENPALFLRACLLRFARFWNVVPLGPERAALPRWLLWGTGLFYGLLWTAALVGLAGIARSGRSDRSAVLRWGPVLLLVVSFTLVHLVYWSNARMRAPLMPAVFLISVSWLPAGRTFNRFRRVRPQRG